MRQLSPFILTLYKIVVRRHWFHFGNSFMRVGIFFSSMMMWLIVYDMQYIIFMCLNATTPYEWTNKYFIL